MTYTEEYQEHIQYTFHTYCKIVIYHAAIDPATQRAEDVKKKYPLFLSIFRFPCTHGVSIAQTTTFSYLNPPSKASEIAVALFLAFFLLYYTMSYLLYQIVKNKKDVKPFIK